MKDEVVSAIQVILSNPSVTERERETILQACRLGSMPAAPPKLVTLKRAAEILQVHPKSIRRYTTQGHLHPVRYSKRRYRYAVQEVEDFAARGIKGDG